MSTQYDARFTGMVNRGLGVGRGHDRVTVFDTCVEGAKDQVRKHATGLGYEDVTIDHIVRHDGGKQ